MHLKILQAGEVVLRSQARPLTRDDILSNATQTLIEDMRETMRNAPGVGLAAPQVGVSLQVAVIEDRAEYYTKFSPEQLAERERRPIQFHVLINPRVTSADTACVEFFEGCLSVAGYTAIVPRMRNVTVDFLTERAKPARVQASGWYARILQHEIDHLSGTLYIDRMNTRTLCTLENYEHLWKDVPVAAIRAKLL